MWQDWLQMAPHVLNISGNQYKSFPSRTEALHWYYTIKVDGNVVVIVPYHIPVPVVCTKLNWAALSGLVPDPCVSM